MLYVIAPTSSDLYHHGILGQKWGHRNGPPYPLGSSSHSRAEKKAGWQKSLKSNKSSSTRQSLINGGSNSKKVNDKELLDKIRKVSPIADWEQEYIKDANTVDDKSKTGIKYKEIRKEFNSYLKNDNTIKKGTEAERVTTTDEILDNKRKYVSILEGDKSSYSEIFDMLIDPSKDLAIDTYEFKKDAKFANADEVFNWMVDKYGDISIKETYDMKKHMDDIDLDFIQYVNQKKTDKVKIVSNRYKKNVKAFTKDEINRIKEIQENLDNLHNFNKKLYDTKINNEAVKEFKKRGYDAIVDIEDAGNIADVPLIVLDPKDSLKFVKRETW